MASLVVKEGVVSIRAERARQDSNIAKDTLQWLIQDIRHLVLEVLGGDEWVEQVDSPLALHSLDFTTSSRDVGVGVEGLPEVVQRVAARLRTDVEQDAHIRVQGLSERVETPTMRVELLVVLLLETEDHLARDDALLCALELEVGVERDLGGILVHMCLDGSLVDVVLGDAVLVHAHRRQGIQRSRVDVPTPIGDDADDNLLPPGLAPGPRFAAAAEVGNVLHDGVHGPRKTNLVLVVHGDADEELRLARRPADVLAQLVPFVHKVVRVAGDGRVPHVRELDLVSARQEAVQDGGDLALEDELAVDQLDLLPGRLRRADASPLLSALGGGAVVLELVLVGRLELIAQRLLGLGLVGLAPHLVAQVVRQLGAKGVVVDLVAEGDGDRGVVGERRGPGRAREQGHGRQRAPRAAAIAG